MTDYLAIARAVVSPLAAPPTQPEHRENDGDAPAVCGPVGDVSHERNEQRWASTSAEDFAYLTGPRNYPGPCPWCGGRLRHNPRCDELRASWEPEMPIGRHKGKRVSEVPRDELEWFARSAPPRYARAEGGVPAGACGG